MTKFAALLVGIAAWAAVAALTIGITFNMGDKNQVLMFLPILAAVIVAWGIGEEVTERVFVEHKEGLYWHTSIEPFRRKNCTARPGLHPLHFQQHMACPALARRAGVSRFESCIRAARPGGTISSAGYCGDGEYVKIPRLEWGLGMGDKTIRTGLCPGGRERMERLMRLIEMKRVDPRPLTSHRIKFDEMERGFHMMETKEDGMIKPLIEFPQS
jgi:threonine dehydrogenase-like Zn-dependent dehydrogenase